MQAKTGLPRRRKRSARQTRPGNLKNILYYTPLRAEMQEEFCRMRVNGRENIVDFSALFKKIVNSAEKGGIFKKIMVQYKAVNQI